MKKRLIRTDDVVRRAASRSKLSPGAAAPDPTTRAEAHGGPTVKTNIVLPRDLYGRLGQALRWRQEDAFRRGAKPPRGISQLIAEALERWLADNPAPQSHRSA